MGLLNCGEYSRSDSCHRGHGILSVARLATPPLQVMQCVREMEQALEPFGARPHWSVHSRSKMTGVFPNHAMPQNTVFRHAPGYHPGCCLPSLEFQPLLGTLDRDRFYCQMTDAYRHTRKHLHISDLGAGGSSARGEDNMVSAHYLYLLVPT